MDVMESFLTVNKGVMSIENSNGKIYWDSAAFRPDVKFVLEENKKYRASVFYGIVNLPSGKIVKYPTSIKIGTRKFVNIR